MTDLVRKVCTRGRGFLVERLPLAIVFAVFALPTFFVIPGSELENLPMFVLLFSMLAFVPAEGGES